MGQKTNPNIMGLGVRQKEWSSKYNIKNKEENNLHNFNDLQIKAFLSKFLYDNGMSLYNLKIKYTDKAIFIFLSFIVNKKISKVIQKGYEKENLKIKKRKITKKNRERIIQGLQKIRNKIIKDEIKTDITRKIHHVIKKNKINRLKNKNMNNKRKNFYNKNIRTKKCNLFFLKNYKKGLIQKISNNKTEVFKKAFIEKITGSISLFTNKNLDLRIIFKSINSKKFLFLEKQERIKLKKTLFSLRRFRRKDFFKEAIIILYISINQKGPADLLANYLANQLGKGRRQTYFINFFKRILTIMLSRKKSKTGGVKIIIKGKFNYRPRSKKRIITIGKCPVQTFKAEVNQSEATTYTSTGTFGVKILKYEKLKN